MKINSYTDIPSSSSPVSQTAQAASNNAQKASQGAAETAKSTGNSPGVQVSMSTMARSMEKPESVTASDVDTAKVNAMKAAIQNGTFTVNHDAIADKLLSNAQEMMNSTATPEGLPQ
jgi:negative regulator of flagellin synthesis FlgM